MGVDKKYNNFVPLNAPFTVNDFEREIRLIVNAGFNLIGLSHFYIEDTFIFDTADEAKIAGNMFELDNEDDPTCIVGWWYGKKEFEDAVKIAKIPPNKIIWLNEN
jgi:hypothetical protein